MQSMDVRRAEQLMAHFPDCKVAVVGDVMLDKFTWGEVRRISPEAPVPIVEVIEETDRLGGSANVVANIKSLGGNPLTISIIGNDEAGERVMALYESQGIDSHLLLTDDRQTTIKNRIIAHNQQVVRTDREDRRPLSLALNKALEQRFLQVLGEIDAVVVSDYAKGVVNRHLLEAILPKAADASVPVFLDPKVEHADYYKPTTLVTPNQREAELLSGTNIRDTPTLEEAGRQLLERFQCRQVIITRGKDGLSVFDRETVRHLPAAAREVFDVSGAGDTVIATVALASASGIPTEQAAFLANRAAGIVVGKVGTATVTRTELLDSWDV